MSNGNFYTPGQIEPLYKEVIPAYQQAFAGEPWLEVSRCPDKKLRCPGGLSSLAIGQYCATCQQYPLKPAYEASELVAKFELIGASRPTKWYVEQNECGVNLAAVLWRANAELVAAEKYPEVPAMQQWMDDRFSGGEFVWLDEIFANFALKPNGNLRNFGDMCKQAIGLFGNQTIAFRTINQKLEAATKREFGESASFFVRDKEVPDRRDFVVIKIDKENK